MDVHFANRSATRSEDAGAYIEAACKFEGHACKSRVSSCRVPRVRRFVGMLVDLEIKGVEWTRRMHKTARGGRKRKLE